MVNKTLGDNNAVEAQMAKNLLETNGIDACVTEDQSASLFGTFNAIVGGVKLLVNEDDALRAELILSAVGDDTELDEEDEAAPKSEEIAAARTCPTCGRSFGVEFTRCPHCPPSEEVFENDPTRPRANLAPMGPEDEAEERSPCDDMARRALWSSVFGLTIFTLVFTLYAMYLILRICLGGAELHPRSWTKVYIAFALCVVELGVIALGWRMLGAR
jgi:hypothetical protein